MIENSFQLTIFVKPNKILFYSKQKEKYPLKFSELEKAIWDLIEHSRIIDDISFDLDFHLFADKSIELWPGTFDCFLSFRNLVVTCPNKPNKDVWILFNECYFKKADFNFLTGKADGIHFKIDFQLGENIDYSDSEIILRK